MPTHHDNAAEFRRTAEEELDLSLETKKEILVAMEKYQDNRVKESNRLLS